MSAEPVIDARCFRDAMARLGAAVNLITTDGPAGLHGMTASAVCSVTDTPPTLLVCINRSAAVHERLKRNGVLCVNVLAGRHQALSARFANPGLSIAERFAAPLRWSVASTGAPVLSDAAAAFDCRVAEISEVGTHSVFFCEVASVFVSEAAEGLIYFDRAYHRVGARAPHP
jgi:flavin reductase